MNEGLLVSAHGYEGDAGQIKDLLPLMEHHKAPVVIISPEDSKITNMGPHWCMFAGKRAYVGQDSLDRQHLQLKLLLTLKDPNGEPFKWFLMNDSDSFASCTDLPAYLFEDDNILYSNEVDDFRRPGEVWENLPPWPQDYHKGYPLKAFQPPYFCGRKALEKLVAVGPTVACPITPFIDWQMVVLAVDGGVKHARFRNCVSCETRGVIGQKIVSNAVSAGANFIHSVKDRRIAFRLMDDYKRFLAKK